MLFPKKAFQYLGYIQRQWYSPKLRLCTYLKAGGGALCPSEIFESSPICSNWTKRVSNASIISAISWSALNCFEGNAVKTEILDAVLWMQNVCPTWRWSQASTRSGYCQHKGSATKRGNNHGGWLVLDFLLAAISRDLWPVAFAFDWDFATWAPKVVFSIMFAHRLLYFWILFWWHDNTGRDWNSRQYYLILYLDYCRFWAHKQEIDVI